MSVFPVGSTVSIEHAKPWKGTVTMTGVVRRACDGYLLLERTFTPGGRYDSLGDLKHVGDHGIVEVIEGGWVLRRAYFRRDGRLIGELYNIQTACKFLPGRVSYTDLEVDVVRRPDGQVEVVDEDDLTEAVRLGGISPELSERALAIAHRLADILRHGGDWREASMPPEASPITKAGGAGGFSRGAAP